LGELIRFVPREDDHRTSHFRLTYSVFQEAFTEVLQDLFDSDSLIGSVLVDEHQGSFLPSRMQEASDKLVINLTDDSDQFE
jgi:hypothetical protein